MISWSVQNITNFVTSFTVPYLMDTGYVNLGPKVGFVNGSIGVLAVSGRSFTVLSSRVVLLKKLISCSLRVFRLVRAEVSINPLRPEKRGLKRGEHLF